MEELKIPTGYYKIEQSDIVFGLDYKVLLSRDQWVNRDIDNIDKHLDALLDPRPKIVKYLDDDDIKELGFYYYPNLKLYSTSEPMDFMQHMSPVILEDCLKNKLRYDFKEHRLRYKGYCDLVIKNKQEFQFILNRK